MEEYNLIRDYQHTKLIDSLDYPFYIIDVSDYTLKLCNSTAKTIFGDYKSTDTCYSLTHGRKTPCTGEEHPCPLKLVKKKKKPVTIEHVHLDTEGKMRVYEIHCHPIFDENGTIKQAIEYTLDITERKKVERSLQRSKENLNQTNQLLEQILNTTDILIAFMDPQFNFVKVNRAYARADDQEPEFFPGRNHFDLYPNKENEKIFNRVVKQKEPYFTIAKAFSYEEHPERGVSYWDWSLIPIFDLNNIVMGLVLTLQDVTDRVRMEKALKQSEKKFKSITELAHEIIMRIKPDGKCTYINRSGVEFFGKLKKEILQDNILNFVHANDLRKMKLFLKRVTRDIDHIEETIINFIVPIGVRVIEWNASPIIDDSRNVVEVQLSGRDITELQEELIEINKLAAVGQLAAGVAHEINSPLANITLKAEYLLNVINQEASTLEKSLLDRELVSIKNEVKMCSKIVTELLQFSRKIYLTPTNFKVKPLISKLLSSPSINFRIIEKKISVNLQIKEDLEAIGDKALLSQVFQNIINNSIDAMENIKVKPRITIAVVKKGNILEIKMTDNGIGIKKINLTRVFEPFFSTKPLGKGTGLGLSICRGIIEKHKGKIKIKSTYGHGTEILITIPNC
ncbi:MAG: PAS domain-containing sensor histidine kinase [Candidatus Heimdallarchaeota archaeon]|nr:MAG: PAS domain-containing sensor histidine kinase [Candidatus Heimdallarchaeota archaeon]